MSSVLALPALIANEVDVIQFSAVPLINASLRGFDVVFIAGMLNTMIWDLYARPEIKSAEQLKGKIVGTERPGSPVAYGTRWRCANWDSRPKMFSCEYWAAARRSPRRC